MMLTWNWYLQSAGLVIPYIDYRWYVLMMIKVEDFWCVESYWIVINGRMKSMSESQDLLIWNKWQASLTNYIIIDTFILTTHYFLNFTSEYLIIMMLGIFLYSDDAMVHDRQKAWDDTTLFKIFIIDLGPTIGVINVFIWSQLLFRGSCW